MMDLGSSSFHCKVSPIRALFHLDQVERKPEHCHLTPGSFLQWQRLPPRRSPSSDSILRRVLPVYLPDPHRNWEHLDAPGRISDAEILVAFGSARKSHFNSRLFYTVYPNLEFKLLHIDEPINILELLKSWLWKVLTRPPEPYMLRLTGLSLHSRFG